MIIIKTLKEISFKALYEVFKEAFKDYEMQLTHNQLEAMLTRRGFVEELSFGAFDGGKLVSFTLNGIGKFQGINTAYDTGTATIEEYRGQGLASRIFNYSLPHLKEAGIHQYLLEVLQNNSQAISVYKKLDFVIVREFNYFSQLKNSIEIDHSKINIECSVDNIDLSYEKEMMAMWDFYPSWQNTFDSVSRQINDFKIIGATSKNDLVGYAILEENSGDITQLAVSKEHRRKGIGTLLFKELHDLNRYNSMKAINTEIDCESVSQFFTSVNLELKGTQFEMIRKL